MSVRRIDRRLLALCLAASAVITGTASSHASTADRLDRARARLQALSGEIAAQSQAVEAARSAAADGEARAAEADQALVPLIVHRVQVAQRVAEVQAELDAAQQRFHDAVVQAFIAAPGVQPGADTFAAVLDANSFQDLQDQLAFGEAAANVRAKAIQDVTALDQQLTARGSTLDDLITAAQDVRTQRDAALQEQQAALVREQQAMDALNQARTEIVALIDRLRAKLAPKDVQAVARAFQGDHNMSYGSWSDAFLRVMGAPRCRSNVVVTIAWQAQEGTQADWNPLATTHRMDGSTDFNSVGVQNYRTLAQGLEATKETIENGWRDYGYGAVIRSMRDCADPMSTAQAIAASSWCSGCAGGQYVMGIVPAVEASFETYYDL
ncbi:MAG TPA: hypothetical protein VHW68_03640 [Actinomycetota bacterium]|nr:hypothetical protein [Actinomycetota bacterium]